MLFGKKSLVAGKDMLSLKYLNVDTIRATGQPHRRLRTAMNPEHGIYCCRGSQFSTSPFESGARACLGCSPQDLGPEFVANNADIVALSSSQPAPHIFAIGACLPNWIWRAMIHAPLAAFKASIVRNKIDSAQQGLHINTNVLGILLEQYLRGKTKYAISPEGIAAQFSALVYADQDPTANTIAFGLSELAKHPEFQQKLRAEMQSNIGVFHDNMPRLNAFIKILRLYPAAALIQRIAVHDAAIPLSDEGDTVQDVGNACHPASDLSKPTTKPDEPLIRGNTSVVRANIPPSPPRRHSLMMRTMPTIPRARAELLDPALSRFQKLLGHDWLSL
ncbi:cytochrome P450 [Mycena olivaceomarginata]|nr:cytochrome P450 [Mycena olivaceomarginata]